MFCIVLFTIIYYSLDTQFDNLINKQKNSLIDFFQLSTTIQAGVGVTNLTPKTPYSKIALISQQFVMLTSHLFSLYIFTL
jgi:hypothetical protein